MASHNPVQSCAIDDPGSKQGPTVVPFNLAHSGILLCSRWISVLEMCVVFFDISSYRTCNEKQTNISA